MERTGNRTFIKFSLLWLSCLMLSCSSKSDQLAMEKEPTIDFRALADFSDTPSEFSQVLLRIQLLNTNADILKHGLATPEEHQRRLSYFLLGFKNDISLISHSDTIPCYDLHMERTYMDLPYMNFILTFNHRVSSGNELMIKDLEYSKQIIFTTIEPNRNVQ